MHNTNPLTSLKRPAWVLSMSVDIHALPKGHQAHRSGAGVIADRRTKRNRTRTQQKRTAMGEW